MSGFLILETGEAFPGRWHGGEDRAGEVVFNTSHSGYEEMATDPSYMKQIIVLTAPMQGNYGIDDKVWESKRIWIEGFVCVQIQNSSQDEKWKKRLTDKKVPLISEIDTRTLVLRLRSGGTQWGALVHANSESEAKNKAMDLIESSRKIEKDWVWLASRKEVEKRQGKNPRGPLVAVLDLGSKENILRELENRSKGLIIFPSRTSSEEILNVKPDGIMLTNGPGDPQDVKIACDTIRALIGRVPVFGICMGHQILALALGGKTYKMKFGHRGSNHPIKDDLLNEIYVTSQNHGYAVDEKSLPVDIKITHRNLNDQSVAGFYSAKKNVLGIQYHPEACPGPHEAYGLFNFFVEKMMGFSK
jgi:carbamoyl-phosphate synthase small subunit